MYIIANREFVRGGSAYSIIKHELTKEFNMKRYVRARGGGKTHEMMNGFKSSSSLFLVRNSAEKNRLVKDYELNKKESDRILLWHTAKERIAGTDLKIMIDNLDDFLRWYFNREVDVVSFTGISK